MLSSALLHLTQKISKLSTGGKLLCEISSSISGTPLTHAQTERKSFYKEIHLLHVLRLLHCLAEKLSATQYGSRLSWSVGH